LTTSVASATGITVEGCPQHEQEEIVFEAKSVVRATKDARRFVRIAKCGQ
jgi:hypothetical protein